MKLKEQGIKCREVIKEIKHDTRVTWNGRDVFEMHVPTDVSVPERKRSYNVCSIDPGEKIFCSTYGSDGNSYLIGQNGSEKVDKLASIAARIRNGIQRTIGHDGKIEFKRSES